MTVDVNAPPGDEMSTTHLDAELTAEEKRFFKDRGWSLAGTTLDHGAVCRTCHGTGRQATETIQPEWLPLLRQLRETGEVIATYRNARNERLDRLYYPAVDKICQLTKDARSLGVPMKIIAGAVEVSPTMIYNYLSGNFGGKGVRETHPVKTP